MSQRRRCLIYESGNVASLPGFGSMYGYGLDLNPAELCPEWRFFSAQNIDTMLERSVNVSNIPVPHLSKERDDNIPCQGLFRERF